MPITDPQIRKTMYKLTLYANPGTMNVNVNFKIDFDAGNDPSVIQPPAITVSSAAAVVVLVCLYLLLCMVVQVLPMVVCLIKYINKLSRFI